MSRFVDAQSERFEEIEIFGVPALFTSLRISKDSVPLGVYKYEIRHDDECRGIACEVARVILVNHWGPFLTLRPLDLGDDGRIYMDGDEINYGIDSNLTLEDFKKKHEREHDAPNHNEQER
ncbi:MAG: hypothetical protein IKZ82_08080 [Clostridia bacterium]|nr:hypothetical protein [Clostridia bacterium]